MDNSYFLELLKQYQSANGVKDDDVRYADFEQWLSDYRIMTDDYAYFLENYGYNLGDKGIAEVGK